MTNMRKWYRAIATVYFVVALFMLVFTRWTINGIDDRRLYLLVMYTPIAVSSMVVAIFAVQTAIENRRLKKTRWRLWPPEFDNTVALWATTKSLFFAVLWLYGAQHIPPDWVLPFALTCFAIGHLLFDDQWFGNDYRETTHSDPEGLDPWRKR